MGSTAYGIEAVLGGVGYLLICPVLHKVAPPLHPEEGRCCAATMLHCKIKSLRGYGVLRCNIDV